jgi:hypothetical protein
LLVSLPPQIDSEGACADLVSLNSATSTSIAAREFMARSMKLVSQLSQMGHDDRCHVPTMFTNMSGEEWTVLSRLMEAPESLLHRVNGRPIREPGRGETMTTTSKFLCSCAMAFAVLAAATVVARANIGRDSAAPKAQNIGTAVALNPQPLPPRCLPPGCKGGGKTVSHKHKVVLPAVQRTVVPQRGASKTRQ